MTAYLAGLLTALVPVAGLCVLLDRRDESRRRVHARVDQIPTPLPGAYERPHRPALRGTGGPTVLDQES